MALGVTQPLAGEFAVTVSNVRDLSSNTIAPGSRRTGLVLCFHSSAVGDAAAQPASAACSGISLLIKAGGSDIGEANDSFVYHCLIMTNDFDLRLRIQSLRGGAELSRAPA